MRFRCQWSKGGGECTGNLFAFVVVNVVAISYIVVSVLAIFWRFSGERCGNIST